jgi:hypothetical protein
MRPMLKVLKVNWSLCYYALAVIIIALICKTSWPGFMSFDSLDALHESRTGIHWNINCPTMVIWFQGICDHIYAGPGLLFLIQVATTFIALADILFVAEVVLWIGIPFMIFFACCPAILGPMLVVWKDVGMMAFFMAATSSLLRAQKSATTKTFWCKLAIFWTFLACSFKLNAIMPALPIFFAISRVLAGQLKKTVVYSLVLILSTAAILWFINSFKFESDISLIDPYPTAFFQAFDILGVSALSGQNMLPKKMYDVYKDFTIDDLRKDYYPENSNKGFFHSVADQKPLVWKCSTEQIMPLWQTVIFNHPHQYLRHRWKAFKALLAIHMAEPYYLTHPGVDANDLGVTFKPSRLTPYVLQYLSNTSITVFAHPWFYYLSACILLLLSIVLPECRSQNVLMLLLSSVLNVAPMFFLVASAELRFNLWSIAAIILTFALTANNISKRRL